MDRGSAIIGLAAAFLVATSGSVAEAGPLTLLPLPMGYTDPRTNAPAFSYAHPTFWAPFTLVGDGGGGATGQ